MSLMDSITKPAQMNERPLLWIIFGPAKIGKTTLAASFPAPLLIDIEGGTGFINVPQFNLGKAVSAGQTAHQILGALYKEMRDGSHPYKTVIFDTADELWNVLAKPKRKAGKIPLSEYQELYEQFMGILEAYRALGLDIVLTAHVKSETDDDGRVTSTDVKLPGQLQGMVTGKVDEIVYMTMKRSETTDGSTEGKQDRLAVCQPMEHPKLGQIRAGDRSGQLPQFVVNPTFNDLSIAKTFKLGLFDGMGDTQDVPEHVAEFFDNNERFEEATVDADTASAEAEELFGSPKKNGAKK